MGLQTVSDLTAADLRKNLAIVPDLPEKSKKSPLRRERVQSTPRDDLRLLRLFGADRRHFRLGHQLADTFFHFLARLENHDILRIDIHLIAGRGLRALRALRLLTSKTPKFRNSMRFSVKSVSTMASKVFCTISLVLSWVSPSFSEICLTISFLVTSRFSLLMGYVIRFVKCNDDMD